ncbi:MAG: fimbrial biogenesis chaperone [Hafnia alvei]|jgi:fimbrial chaperone protein|uniref:Molecular chaperone n=1 Tax=Hafnia alvei TaxID=569 RepID=A0ABD7PYQ8_HAFAL|nr:molecular chaperone [Hafnia alvei]ANC40285.1 pilus assembly protein [Hafnia alvei]KAA0261419.1 molecular chaperone [Hafnia alvei]MBI0277960.1 molecular chaperone [Hafnia alvei]PNK96877.1 molecular chaperone [Hafnia alvei]TBL65200.1 molecular chaperone [Hafnia alvei]
MLSVRDVFTGCVLALCLIASAQASVVMTGNRVVYPAQNKEVNIQLTNHDDFPNVIQVWMDSGNEDSTPETGQAPFIITPPFFKMAAKAGQTVRLMFTGAQLPQDRESVYYLNFLQIPPREAKSSSNQMLIMLRNRVKVFYRPAGITTSPAEIAQNVKPKIVQRGNSYSLELENMSGYYLSISGASILSENKVTQLGNKMIAPFSTEAWPVPSRTKNPELTINYINDQGAKITHRYQL